MSDDEDAPFVQQKKPKVVAPDAAKPKTEPAKPAPTATDANGGIKKSTTEAAKDPKPKAAEDDDDKPLAALKPKPKPKPEDKKSAEASSATAKAASTKPASSGTPVKKPEQINSKVTALAPKPTDKKPEAGSSTPKQAPADGEKKAATTTPVATSAKPAAAKPATAASSTPTVKREKPADEDDAPLSSLKKPAAKPADDDDLPLTSLKKTPVKTEGSKPAAASTSPASAKKAASTPTKKSEATPKSKTSAKKDDSSSSSSSSDSDSDSDSSSGSGSSSSGSSSSSSSSSGSDSGSASSDGKKKKKAAAEKPKKAKTTVKKATPSKAKGKADADSTAAKKKKPKKEDADGASSGRKRKKADEDDEAADAAKWDKRPKLPEGVKWLSLEHAGVLFPEPYKPHGIPVLYEGKPVTLTSEQEEIATFYAQYLETDHVKKPQFNKNFFEAWQRVLTGSDKKGKHVIKDLAKVDFSPIRRHLLEQKEVKKARSKEEKQHEKEEKEQWRKKYGVALVDGVKEKIGNYRIEPPGLFLGRGAHPKTGMLKARIHPEDVTINIGAKAPVPVPPAGHKWKKVVHDNTVSWLAFWKEPINNGHKYVWLAAGSRIKGESDMKKFDVARQLKNKIDEIRKDYESELSAKDIMVRQRATATWIIDHLALRAGNEKDEESADTVGCCSLRVEHIKLHPPTTVEFDFLGKDSMRYFNTVQVSPAVFKNLEMFQKGKADGTDLFDHLTTASLNAHLKKFMKGLTAKVFRTYNASITLERELAKAKIDDNDTVEEKVLAFNRANREVAILCNHQRSQPKKHDEQMGKMDDKLKQLQEERDLMEQHAKNIKAGKVRGESTTIKLKRKLVDDDDDDDDAANAKKKLKSDKDVAAAKKVDKDKDEKKVKVKDEEKDELVLTNDPEKLKSRLSKLQARLHTWEIKKTEKDELKTVSLSTSKINYIDPRITAAWAKRTGVPLEKLFSKTLREKFTWAMVVPPEWHF